MSGQSKTDEGLRELAERLVAHPHPLGRTSVELFPRALPDVGGVDLVLPAEGRLLGSAIHRRDGELVAVEAVVDVDQPMRPSIAGYEEELRRRNWTVHMGLWGGGGFVPTGGGMPRSFRRGQSGPILAVSADDRAAGGTELRLRLDWDMPRHAMPRHHQPEGAELMPSLYGPPDVPMEGGGGGGGDSHWSTQATATTTMPPAELTRYFEEQLAATGWTRIAGGSADVAAWSAWDIPSKKGWHGVLIVMTSGESDERSLMLHLQGPSTKPGLFRSAISNLIHP
jgi:hypothetical protein